MTYPGPDDLSRRRGDVLALSAASVLQILFGGLECWPQHVQSYRYIPQSHLKQRKWDEPQEAKSALFCSGHVPNQYLIPPYLKFREPCVYAETEVPLVVYRVHVAEMLKEHGPVGGAQRQAEAGHGEDKEGKHFSVFRWI